ncbi:MAG: aminopeptidase N [Hyphomicrobiales bacterium]|nr:MAG: aminopeptidase N [Hyphomicrobiales bacterium]
MRTDTAKPVRLSDYTPTPYAIATVDLDIDLDPAKTTVVAKLVFERRAGIKAGTALVLDGDGLDLVSVLLDGAALGEDAYEATPDRLTIKAPPAGPFTLEIVTRIAPEANTALMGLYRSSGNYCTQCEAEGFRRITYFLDRPDVLSVYTVRISADKAEAPVLLANGNPIEAGDLDGGRHFALWHDPFPKPSYLFAMVAGDLAMVRDSFTTMNGRVVDLRIYVEKGKEDRCGYAMDALKRSMRWDEEAFGREYDLDIFMIVAVGDFNMGAMENKGLNVFNDRYILANPDTATDQDYANIEAIIAHEYFHNWSGNRVTCRDWFQLCLKEGLTVFRDQEFTSDQRSRPVKRIGDVRLLKAHQFPEDGGPLAHPVRPTVYNEINNFYTATVYEKGAEVVRMLKTVVGDTDFRAGMDLYFDRHDGEAVTIEDFLACFAEASGLDLTQFALWYAQSGTPAVTASASYDETAKRFTLELEQAHLPTPGQAVKKAMHIPIRFGLVGPNGADLPFDAVEGAAIKDGVLHLVEGRQTVTFEGVAARPAASLLRGFSAPVKLLSNQGRNDLVFLSRHDSDPFNRWQAMQTLAMDYLVTATAMTGAGETIHADAVLIDALGSIAGDDSLEPAFRALCLQMPSENDIAREIGEDVDPDAIAQARTMLRGDIATGLVEVFGQLAENGSDGPYSPDATAAGVRGLRNVALDYRLIANPAAIAPMLLATVEDADNMTDRMAALTSLVMHGADEADAALDIFYRRFEGDALVYDKWLSVQAMAPAPKTLARVQALTEHERFSFANPNRVRSLVGSFATGNPTQFNRSDGKGFAFVADVVLKLDKTNPQVAARLLSAFRSWRALEPARKAAAEKELTRIATAPELSPDVLDIVTRSLQ